MAVVLIWVYVLACFGIQFLSCFHLLCVYDNQQVKGAGLRPFGKVLLIRFTIFSLCILTICKFSHFPFWFRGPDFGSDCISSWSLFTFLDTTFFNVEVIRSAFYNLIVTFLFNIELFYKLILQYLTGTTNEVTGVTRIILFFNDFPAFLDTIEFFT